MINCTWKKSTAKKLAHRFPAAWWHTLRMFKHASEFSTHALGTLGWSRKKFSRTNDWAFELKLFDSARLGHSPPSKFKVSLEKCVLLRTSRLGQQHNLFIFTFIKCNRTVTVCQWQLEPTSYSWLGSRKNRESWDFVLEKIKWRTLQTFTLHVKF